MDFNKLYKENVDSIRKVCYSYLKNDEDVEDAVQDTFLKVSQSLDSFNSDSAVSTWLTKIAKNVCSDKLKARKKEQAVFQSNTNEHELWSESYQDVATPEAIAETDEYAEQMLAAFNQLNRNTRDAMVLRFVDDCSYKEIAEELGVPVGTVRTWLHRGRIQILGTVSPQ